MCGAMWLEAGCALAGAVYFCLPPGACDVMSIHRNSRGQSGSRCQTVGIAPRSSAGRFLKRLVIRFEQ